MNVIQFKEELIAYSKEIGIDKIGFTTAAPFTELKNRLIRQQELGFQSGLRNRILKNALIPPCSLKSRTPS